jgi:O-antigen biosynthesis protein WbqV
MGQPVKIVDLAERMIKLSGLEPGKDIEIKFTGARPGERLHEILFAREEPITEIGIDGIVAARPLRPSIDDLRSLLRALEDSVGRGERGAIDRILRSVVPDFQKEAV